MLELIFQGFLQWIYDLMVEIWEFFADSLIGIMSMDFAYLREHMPVIDAIQQSMLAVGWALLIGNLVFQAAKSMMSGLGFEGEDPKLLFIRTFVFSFLLLVSPQICELCLNMTSAVIQLVQMPTAVEVTFFNESAFDGIACAWLIVIICGSVIIFKSLKLILEMAERYFILAVLTITAPLAFGVGGSKNTSEIFTGWCRMYGSMCLLMVTNVMFVKMLFSVLSIHPVGIDVFPWMVLLLTVVKVAKKADEIVTRIGLNPAITGGARTSLPGMLTYTVLRTAAAQVTKAVGASLGGGSGAGGGSSPRTTGPRTRGPSGGKAGVFSGGARNTQQKSQYTRQQNSSRNTDQQANSQQSSTYQSDFRQPVTGSNTQQATHMGAQNTAYSETKQSSPNSGVQGSTRAETQQAATRDSIQNHTAQAQTVGNATNNVTQAGGHRIVNSSRKSSVVQGIHRSPTYVRNVAVNSNSQTDAMKSDSFRSNPNTGAVEIRTSTAKAKAGRQSARNHADVRDGNPAQPQGQSRTRTQMRFTHRPANSVRPPTSGKNAVSCFDPGNVTETRSTQGVSKQSRHGRNVAVPTTAVIKEPLSAPARQGPHRAVSITKKTVRINPGMAGNAQDRPGAGQAGQTARAAVLRAETGPLTEKRPGMAGTPKSGTSIPAKQAGKAEPSSKFRRAASATPTPAMRGPHRQTADKSTKRGGKENGRQQ